MLRGDLLHALTGKAAVVNAAVQPFFGKLGIAHLSPCLPPRFQRLRLAPVRRGNGVEHIVVRLVQNAFPMLVRHIFPPLFVPPPTVVLDGANRTHDVKMQIGNADVLLIR